MGRIQREPQRKRPSADAVVLFVDQYMTESADAQSLRLPGEQDRLVEAVTRANPHTAVVLETGGPVLMPWLDQTGAVLEAWYPGQKGGEAIAEILSGAASPSGRLPITFPVSEDQLPHPKIQGDPNGAPIGPVGRGGHYGAMFTAVKVKALPSGYKWFFERGHQPLFPFGFGLSYTSFALSQLVVNVARPRGDRYRDGSKFRRALGTAIPEFYLSGPDGAHIPLRLVGWDRIELKPAEERSSNRLARPPATGEVRRGRPKMANPSRRLPAYCGARFPAAKPSRKLRASVGELCRREETSVSSRCRRG